MTEPSNNESEQVSKEEISSIVTKEPVAPAVAKIKDPKKIEAGKKLAAYNKRAKKIKKELKENSTGVVVVEDTNQGGSGFDITLTTVIALIGLGLTMTDLYFRHKKNYEKEDHKMSIIDYKPVCNLNEKTPVDNGVENEKNIKANKVVKKVRFKPGMA